MSSSFSPYWKAGVRAEHAVERCVGCGATVPVVQGPVHRYMTAAPGCWVMFADRLAPMYHNPHFTTARQLSVDAYAVQHPGSPNSQAIQSVAAHLLSLYAYIELNQPVTGAPRLLARATSVKALYVWLTPPSYVPRRTVADMPHTADPTVVTVAAWEWARAAWDAWRAHHAQVAEWYTELTS